MSGAAAGAGPARPSAALDAVAGMLLLLGTEAMFFGGLLSGYVVSRANAPGWPPADQPRLPVATTAGNTVILLASALTLVLALRARRSPAARATVGRWLRLTAVLGAAFLAGQGLEWVRLLRYGLTAASSVYGGFFYVIVGAHGLHVVAGLGLLAWVFRRPDGEGRLLAAGMYWLFVVGLWPVLYAVVYLM